MTIPLEDVYRKTVDKGEQVILKMTLPVIDARDACARFPHEYSRTVDGFAAAAPAPAEGEPVGVGHSGGHPRLNGGIGVKEVIRPAPAGHGKKGSPAAA